MATDGTIRIGAVVSETFAVIGSRARILLPATLLYAVVPALSVILARQVPGRWALLAPYSELPFAALFSAFIARQVFGVVARREETARQSLAALPSIILPLLALQIMAWLGIIVGTLLLIVPGIWISLVWSVSTPALVLEERGQAIDAFRRSADLTLENRWRIFGLSLIYTAVAVAITLVGRTFTEVGGGLTAAPASLGLAIVVIFTVLVRASEQLVVSAGTAVLYVALRTAKEGALEAKVADIFA